MGIKKKIKNIIKRFFSCCYKQKHEILVNNVPCNSFSDFNYFDNVDNFDNSNNFIYEYHDNLNYVDNLNNDDNFDNYIENRMFYNNLYDPGPIYNPSN